MRIIAILLLIISLPVFAYCSDEQRYLVPVTRPEANARKLYSTETSKYETVCVEEQCYYVVSQPAADRLLNEGAAQDYEPVIYRYIQATAPSDPDFSEQWALKNTSIGWLVGKDIMDTLPLLARNGGPVVAVIDTGMVHSHKDMNYNNNQYNILWETGGTLLLYPPGSTIRDTEGHGTHVTGIIGAAIDNDFGIAGVAYGQAHILPANVSNGGETLSSDKIIDAIGFIIDQKNLGVPIVAVNMSFGSEQFSKYEYDAINRLKNAGIIAVTPAGNGHNRGAGHDIGTTPIYPGSYDLANIITVASLGDNLKLADYSNFGGTSGIAAPGSRILSTAGYFVGMGIDNSTNSSGVLYQSTNQFDQFVNTYIPIGSRWGRDGEKLKFTPGSGSDNFTVNNIDLTSISHLKNKAVSLNFTENLACAPSTICSIDMYIKLNDNANWELAASALSTEEKNFLFYVIPDDAAKISVMVSVTGLFNGYSQGVTVHKLLIGGADYADGFTVRSGTSMAVPFVTGALAAGAAIYPEARPEQLVNMLYGTARRSAELRNKIQGSRQIDFAAFLQAVKDCKDAGSGCKVLTDYPERIGGFNSDTRPAQSNNDSKSRNIFGCSMGGKGSITESAAWLITAAVWLVWRRFKRQT